MNISIARERLPYVVRPDSITTSQGDFLATHVSVKRLQLLNKFDFAPTGGKYYTEEQAYQSFVLNPNNQHQFIAVYGVSGTGKSHLIRWFAARYKQDQPDNEVVLFIRRSDNTLKGTIRQLLEKPEIQEISNRDIYDRLLKATAFVDERKLKDMIYANFVIEIRNDDDSHDIRINNVRKKRLEAFLNNDVMRDHLLSEWGPIERIYSKIAENTAVDRDTIAQFVPEDFFVSADLYEEICRSGADSKAEKMARELMSDETKAEKASELANYLNQFVNEVIQRSAGIEPGDFRQIFKEIRRELYRIEKNLTLFIEDVTSFTGVDDALLDALIETHTGLNEEDAVCRISSIVGTTSNYLHNNFRDNHKSRITQYIYIPNDTFDESDLYEFVGRYLNTMSLEESTIKEWLSTRADPAEYPIHDVTEGSLWESVPIGNKKSLCLYPFTKHSIQYLYRNRLSKGQQTPRYVIRDIIEPVVRDVIEAKSSFPNSDYEIAGIDTTLSFLIHNQVKDNVQADRLLRFLSIWGDGKPDQYTKDNVTYVASIRKEILEEFGLPIVSLSETAAPAEPKTQPAVDPGAVSVISPAGSTSIPVSPEKQRRITEANEALTKWINGQSIDISATGGVSGLLNKACESMCFFLLDAINWQAEGISEDEHQKLKQAKNNLMCLERQTKGRGIFMVPSTWDNMNVIMAFARFAELGGHSWNYPEADFDVYLVSSWASSVKNDFIQAVTEKKGANRSSYIEAALAAEIYRMVLYGEFREKKLDNLTIQTLFEAKGKLQKENNHTQEWKSLVTVIGQRGADEINRDTVRQYYNIVQGSGGNMFVLDGLRFSAALRKVKSRKLQFEIDEAIATEQIKPRKDVFSHLRDIYDRVPKAAKAEAEGAREIIHSIYGHFDDEEIEDEDILDLVSEAKEFYSEIDKTQINIATPAIEPVRKAAKQIANAVETIGNVLDEDDPLTVLMAFSSDPLTTVKPLLELLLQLDKDIEKVKRTLDARQIGLDDEGEALTAEDRYLEELKTVQTDLEILNAMR